MQGLGLSFREYLLPRKTVDEKEHEHADALVIIRWYYQRIIRRQILACIREAYLLVEVEVGLVYDSLYEWREALQFGIWDGRP